MPCISKIGARSTKVRLVYSAIFLLLILGAITIIYPFSIMVAGSVKSESDFELSTPYPEFWFSDRVLFQKYIESKYETHMEHVRMGWWLPIKRREFKYIEPPTERSEYLDDFLLWRGQCKWWLLGHSTSSQAYLPINGRKFRRTMYERFAGDTRAFSREMRLPLKHWSTLIPPGQQLTRVPMPRTPYIVAFEEFAKTRPVEDRMLGNPEGRFWAYFLVPTYSKDIEEYNKAHGTDYSSYQEVFLTPRLPENEKQREDWEGYVRELCYLMYIHLSPDLADNFRRFLSERQYDNNIDMYNKSHGTQYASFNEIPLPGEMPPDRPGQLDMDSFLRDSQLCPAEGIEVYGPRQAFEEFVAKRRGVPLEQIRPLRMPIAEADWHDCMAQTSKWRWELTTRNYKHVLEYVVFHGRGVINTAIYCILAIGLALLVNPLAAYALSRYKPPSTYKLLLFCMATMAFPGEVTMIPAFLLLKRFPLWSLIGGAAAFGLSLWIFSKLLRNLPELVRVVLALGVGIAAGAWALPAVTGKPHISLLNTFAALVLPGMANGYSIFLLKGFFDSLPRELYEAADIDGASEWTKFWSFTMALSKPILAVIALWAFIYAYSAFMFALIIIPKQEMWTLMVWIFQLQSRAPQAVVYASLVIAAIPTFIVFLSCQGVIMRGIVVPIEK